MVITDSLTTFGRYCLFISKVFSIPDRWRTFFKRTFFEITKLGVDSIPLVIVISLFIGAVITIQMQLNIVSPLVPSYSTGLATREIILLEFSNSILCLILAGKVGSNIASEIGTMRVTEQIDALDFLIYMPVLVIFCIFTSFLGGVLISIFTGIIPLSRFIYGLQTMFSEWYVWYGLIKSLFFSFIITSVAAFYGYFVKGGALEVGKASTNAVVASSILILLLDVVLTKLLLQ